MGDDARLPDYRIPDRIVQSIRKICVWDCGNPDHKHKRRVTAARCADAEIRRREKLKKAPQIDVLKRVLQLRERDRLKFKEIGVLIGKNAADARHVYICARALYLRGDIDIDVAPFPMQLVTKSGRRI